MVVLGVAAIVSLLGMAALQVAHLQLHARDLQGDVLEAQLLARSAVEYGVNWLRRDGDWRSKLQHNVETTAISLGSGTLSFRLVDDDGNLADDLADGVVLLGYGRVGRATAVQRVQLEPTGTALSCLQASLCCGGDINMGFAADLLTTQRVHSNGSVNATAFGCTIVGSVDAVGSVQGQTNIVGSVTSGVSPRVLPGSGVWAYYLANGTPIRVADLPTGSGGRKCITKAVLSPASNPWGATNPEGIYLLHCGGQAVEIKDSRIVGTLVLIQPASNSLVAGAMDWTPAVANYPALLVDGSMQIWTSNDPLNESWLNTNLNPAGTPYQGASDADKTDLYPSLIKGIVYVSGHLEFAPDFATSTFEGVVACGSIGANSDLTITYNSHYLNYPPPGFQSGSNVRIIPGTWEQAAADTE